MQVVSYTKNGDVFQNWTCSPTDCNSCSGKFCKFYTLKVYRELDGTTPDDRHLVSNCRLGDRVKVEKQERDAAGFKKMQVSEIAITRNPGRENFLYSFFRLYDCHFIQFHYIIR
jgi:hypothetical protein